MHANDQPRPITKAEWVDLAECKRPEHRGLNWFPGLGQPTAHLVAICQSCPVRQTCAEVNLNEPYGIFGGLSGRQRRIIRTQRKRERGGRPPAECGTRSGYHRHRKLHEDPCASCRTANAEYLRTLRTRT